MNLRRLVMSLVVLLGIEQGAAAQLPPRPPVPNRPPPATYRQTGRGAYPEALEEEVLRAGEFGDLRPGTFIRVPPRPVPIPGAPSWNPGPRNSDGAPLPVLRAVAPPYGPASIVPSVPLDGQQASNVPPGTPLSPGALQRVLAGPTPPAVAPSPRVNNFFDPITCPHCGNGVQHRQDALVIGANGQLQYVAPLIPNPGVPVPQGGIVHHYEQCIGCGTRRGESLVLPGEINLGALLQRRQSMMGRLNSYCPTGVCTRIIHGEASIPGVNGETYSAVAGTCVECGASSAVVFEGEGSRVQVLPGGQQTTQGPRQAVGLPGWRINTGHMGDPRAAQRAAEAATQQLREAWQSTIGRR